MFDLSKEEMDLLIKKMKKDKNINSNEELVTEMEKVLDEEKSLIEGAQ